MELLGCAEVACVVRLDVDVVVVVGVDVWGACMTGMRCGALVWVCLDGVFVVDEDVWVACMTGMEYGTLVGGCFAGGLRCGFVSLLWCCLEGGSGGGGVSVFIGTGMSGTSEADGGGRVGWFWFCGDVELWGCVVVACVVRLGVAGVIVVGADVWGVCTTGMYSGTLVGGCFAGGLCCGFGLLV